VSVKSEALVDLVADKPEIVEMPFFARVERARTRDGSGVGRVRW
jgi:hypothetical protein